MVGTLGTRPSAGKPDHDNVGIIRIDLSGMASKKPIRIDIHRQPEIPLHLR
jgi:hypothetical protein